MKAFCNQDIKTGTLFTSAQAYNFQMVCLAYAYLTKIQLASLQRKTYRETNMAVVHLVMTPSRICDWSNRDNRCAQATNLKKTVYLVNTNHQFEAFCIWKRK